MFLPWKSVYIMLLRTFHYEKNVKRSNYNQNNLPSSFVRFYFQPDTQKCSFAIEFVVEGIAFYVFY